MWIIPDVGLPCRGFVYTRPSGGFRHRLMSGRPCRGNAFVRQPYAWAKWGRNHNAPTLLPGILDR